MISSLKIQNDNPKKQQISEIGENYTDMIENRDKLDYFSSIPFVNDILNQNKYEFPQWIFPIVDNQKKLYIEGEELANAEDTEDIINVRLSNEIDEKINIFDEVTKYSSYRKQMKSLKNYKPFN